MDLVASLRRGSSHESERFGGLRPEKGLVGRRAELQIVPRFEKFEPGAEAADSEKSGERVVNQIGGDVPFFDLKREWLRELELAASEDVLAVAAEGNREFGQAAG